MNLGRTLTMAKKELRHILRDPRSLIMALAEPAVMLLLFGYALSLDVDRVPALIYDADRTTHSRELLQRFESSRYFEIRGHVNGYPEIERAIDRGEILFAIAIPSGYGADLQAGRQPEIQLLVDGSDSNTASIALGYISTVVRTYALAIRSGGANVVVDESRLPVQTQLRALFNSTLESKNYVVPGLIATMLMIIAALLTSLTIAREWESGTMEQLMTTPVRPGEIVAGKMMAYFAVGAADTLLAVAMGVWVFGVPLRGDLWLLGLACGIFLTGAFCWGIFLSAAAKSQLIAYQLGITTSFLPAMILSGFLWSIENMPTVIQWITYLVPARHFVTLLKGIFLKGVGIQSLWPELLFLGIFSVLVFVGASRKIRKRLV